jgi:hypothetical protein
MLQALASKLLLKIAFHAFAAPAGARRLRNKLVARLFERRHIELARNAMFALKEEMLLGWARAEAADGFFATLVVRCWRRAAARRVKTRGRLALGLLTLERRRLWGGLAHARVLVLETKRGKALKLAMAPWRRALLLSKAFAPWRARAANAAALRRTIVARSAITSTTTATTTSTAAAAGGGGSGGGGSELATRDPLREYARVGGAARARAAEAGASLLRLAEGARVSSEPLLNFLRFRATKEDVTWAAFRLGGRAPASDERSGGGASKGGGEGEEAANDAAAAAGGGGGGKATSGEVSPEELRALEAAAAAEEAAQAVVAAADRIRAEDAADAAVAAASEQAAVSVVAAVEVAALAANAATLRRL